MQRVIGELNEVCLNYVTTIPHHEPVETSIWWSSFVLKNVRRQMEDYIAVIPYLHKLFDIKVCSSTITIIFNVYYFYHTPTKKK